MELNTLSHYLLNAPFGRFSYIGEGHTLQGSIEHITIESNGRLVYLVIHGRNNRGEEKLHSFCLNVIVDVDMSNGKTVLTTTPFLNSNRSLISTLTLS